MTFNKTNAGSGSIVTLTVAPDSGYVLDTQTVTDSQGNEIRLAAQSGGKYTFTMSGRAVTVKATFTSLLDDTEKPCDGREKTMWSMATEMDGLTQQDWLLVRRQYRC